MYSKSFLYKTEHYLAENEKCYGQAQKQLLKIDPYPIYRLIWISILFHWNIRPRWWNESFVDFTEI